MSLDGPARVATDAAADGAAVARVLQDRLVRPLYQPIVDLERESVIGFEALARGPVGALEQPGQLFEAARAAHRLVALDWLCREQAVAGARAAGLRPPLSLFINAEPETLLGADEDAARWRSFADLRCYAELTERALAMAPAALLRAVDQVREQDWGVAVDDVGAVPESLALLPMLQPDVIKLDLALLQSSPASPGDLGVARVLHAALRQAADTGASVVAEGIETEAHLDLARAYGVQYAQGYLLGRPAPLPDALGSPTAAVPMVPRLLDRSVAPGPFAVVASAGTTRRVTRAGLCEVARQLLAQAVQQDPAAVALVCLAGPDVLAEDHLELLRQLVEGPLTAMLQAPPGWPAPEGVRTRVLETGDPACHDTDVIVIAPHFAAALVARPRLSGDPDGTLDLALTFDRHVVSAAAESLVKRLPGPPARA